MQNITSGYAKFLKCPEMPVISVGLCSTSDIITFNHKKVSLLLKFCRGKSSFCDTQIELSL